MPADGNRPSGARKGRTLVRLTAIVMVSLAASLLVLLTADPAGLLALLRGDPVAASDSPGPPRLEATPQETPDPSGLDLLLSFIERLQGPPGPPASTAEPTRPSAGRRNLSLGMLTPVPGAAEQPPTAEPTDAAPADGGAVRPGHCPRAASQPAAGAYGHRRPHSPARTAPDGCAAERTYHARSDGACSHSEPPAHRRGDDRADEHSRTDRRTHQHVRAHAVATAARSAGYGCPANPYAGTSSANGDARAANRDPGAATRDPGTANRDPGTANRNPGSTDRDAGPANGHTRATDR